MKKEYTTVLSLAILMVVRMLGLFMILPVFSMHAGEFSHATPLLIGIALGIYGLTQALLQIPLGMLSDRIGRKPVMAMGLGVFFVGSIWAALAHTIYGLIIGRALQGGGAIGSTILATVADLTPEASRSKAMGVIGLAVGLAFGIAMIVGPLLNIWVGLSGIFWVTAGLTLIGEWLVWWVIPSPSKLHPERPAFRAGLIRSLQDPDLMRLNAGIFSLHAMLTALFIAIPVVLTQVIHLESSAQTLLYLGVLGLSFILMLPFIIIAEKKQGMKPILRAAICCLLLAQLGLLSLHQHLFSMAVLLLLFFTAFSLLEAILPSWVSKICPQELKGAAMGCYSSAQFLGIFAGGSLGGWVYGHFGVNGIFLLGAAIALVWLFNPYSIARTMKLVMLK
jgi:predicted MFS family arabinose efflux permease